MPTMPFYPVTPPHAGTAVSYSVYQHPHPHPHQLNQLYPHADGSSPSGGDSAMEGTTGYSPPNAHRSQARHSTPRKRTRAANVSGNGSPGNVCSNCNTTDTPMWRRGGDDGKVLLCNKCGLFWARHNKLRPLKVLRRRKRKSPARIDSEKSSKTQSDNLVHINTGVYPPPPTQAPAPSSFPPPSSSSSIPLVRPFVPGENSSSAFAPLVHYQHGYQQQHQHHPVYDGIHGRIAVHPSMIANASHWIQGPAYIDPSVPGPFTSVPSMPQQHQSQIWQPPDSNAGHTSHDFKIVDDEYSNSDYDSCMGRDDTNDSNMSSPDSVNMDLECQVTKSLLSLHRSADKPDTSPFDASHPRHDEQQHEEHQTEIQDDALPARFRFKKKQKMKIT